jgi:hypothetical protein
MRPAEDIEKLIKNTKIDTNTETDDEVLDYIIKAFEESKTKKTSAMEQNIWRIIMKSPVTKIAAAAVTVVVIMLGMYVLTGSFDGTSITMAQVRQAMQNIDWVQMLGTSEQEGISAWYSFASKIQIVSYNTGRILYRDFKAGKELLWNPGGDCIYESPIDEEKQFAGGVSSICEGFTKAFDSIESKGDYEVTKELGTYQGTEVEIWRAHRVKGKAGPTRTENVTLYIDLNKRLPVAAVDVKLADDGARLTNEVQFRYPETGPADIYEAGAPRTAKIRPAPQK